MAIQLRLGSEQVGSGTHACTQIRIIASLHRHYIIITSSLHRHYIIITSLLLDGTAKTQFINIHTALHHTWTTVNPLPSTRNSQNKQNPCTQV